MATKKRATRSKSTRSETVSVRLDPKLRYLAELAARVQRRTLSSYIDWAISESLSRVDIPDSPGRPAIADVADDLWDIDDADRFAKLAFKAPTLLDFDEQRMWKLVQEYGYLWRGEWITRDKTGVQDWSWVIRESGLIYKRLREVWPTLQAIVAGDEDAKLPAWKDVRTTDDPFADVDDIPF